MSEDQALKEGRLVECYFAFRSIFFMKIQLYDGKERPYLFSFNCVQ